MSVFEALKERGFVYQATDEARIKHLVDGEPMTFYLGIDPTADSLHIGHFFALMMFRRLQEAGHKGIVIIGGATALVGDPSGKSQMRKMMDKETVQANLEEVRKLVQRFVRTDGDNPALILNNADWFKGYDYVDFMRDIGVHFNVNTMLTAETYANRLNEGGLTFLEMGYMLMQSYDFVWLNREHNCFLQIGGSDQWGNIVSGIALGRKMLYQEGIERSEENALLGLTAPLLMTKEGKKMGKTEKGTLWVAREKTTVFDFYQYFYNVGDGDTEMLLKLFTYLPSGEIENLVKTDIVKAKRQMAFEVTKLVHGQEAADQVLEAVTSAMKGGGGVPAGIPEFSLAASGESMNVVELLMETNFLSSKSEARRMIKQGGIKVDDVKVESQDEMVALAGKDSIILRRGKKNFLKVLLNN